MPRMTDKTKPDRRKDLADWEDGAPDVANAVFTALTQGAYIGVYHNYTTGVNFTVMYEDEKIKLYASNLFELRGISDEVENWIADVRSEAMKKLKARGKKQPPAER